MDKFNDIQDQLLMGLHSVGSQIPIVLGDPRAYPREAMILALAASLVLVVVVMVGFVVFEVLASTVRRRRLGVRRREAARLLAAFVAVAVVGLVGLTLALAPMVPAAGNSCDVCHALQTPVQTWQDGSHAQVACFGCHARPGVLGALQASAGGLSGMLGGSRGEGVLSTSCLHCHETLRTGVVEVNGLRVQHAEMIEAGMDCLLCHPGTGHAIVTPATSTESTQTTGTAKVTTAQSTDVLASSLTTDARSRMSRCVVCHDGVTASEKCDTCHLSSSLDRVGGEWESSPAPTPVRCIGCHKASTDVKCIECHGLELPHPATFMSQHAGMSYKNPALCAKCHGPQAKITDACGCHDAGETHGEYSSWFPQHAANAAAQWPGGCNCHDPSFCTGCHTNPAERNFFYPSL